MHQFIGFDVHRKETVACVYDASTQEERYETLPTEPDALVAFLDQQSSPRRLAFEVSGLSGRLYDALRPVVDDLQVSNPSQTPWIYRSVTKTDRLDAKKLAILMSVGQLPTVHMPAVDVREWRSLIQHRRRLMQQRTRVQNRIRTLLSNAGVRKPHGWGWWTKKNIGWMSTCVEQLPCYSGLQFQNILDQLNLLNDQVKQVTELLNERAKSHAGVALLQTIPGIGPRTAEAVVAYADDIRRFKRSRQFASYFGVTPRLDESAGVRRQGHISKAGPSVVRWLVVEAAWQAVYRSAGFKTFFERVMHGQKGRKKVAVVAVARKLLTVMFAMLRDGTEFDEAMVK